MECTLKLYWFFFFSCLWASADGDFQNFERTDISTCTAQLEKNNFLTTFFGGVRESAKALSRSTISGKLRGEGTGAGPHPIPKPQFPRYVVLHQASCKKVHMYAPFSMLSPNHVDKQSPHFQFFPQICC